MTLKRQPRHIARKSKLVRNSKRKEVLSDVEINHSLHPLCSGRFGYHWFWSYIELSSCSDRGYASKANHLRKEVLSDVEINRSLHSLCSGRSGYRWFWYYCELRQLLA